MAAWTAFSWGDPGSTFGKVKQKLREDLLANYDYSLHLGQAPGSARVQLEAIGLNIGGSSHQSPGEFKPLVDGGPTAYRTVLPLADWSVSLERAGVPCTVSYHAGTYLCNAALYLACHYSQELKLKTRSAFIHIPLETSQATGQHSDVASLPAALTASGLQIILKKLVQPDVA